MGPDGALPVPRPSFDVEGVPARSLSKPVLEKGSLALGVSKKDRLKSAVRELGVLLLLCSLGGV